MRVLFVNEDGRQLNQPYKSGSIANGKADGDIVNDSKESPDNYSEYISHSFKDSMYV